MKIFSLRKALTAEFRFLATISTPKFDTGLSVASYLEFKNGKPVVGS